MKKLFTLAVITLIGLMLFGQTPQKMSYQAVIRNSSGGLVVSHAVGMKISILLGSASGTAVYVETHITTTNANGLATIEIGGGTVVSGTFDGILWGSATYYLKTEIDPAGGSTYTIVGTSQLLSVPYALFSKSSADGVVLPYSGSARAMSAAAVFEITDNGTTGTPATFGLMGISKNSNGIGVYGRADATSSGNAVGVFGKTSSPGGSGLKGEAPTLGVKGSATSTSIAVTYGVYGSAESDDGYGVYGESPKYGLYGKSTGYQGRALVAEATGTNSIGVRGIAINTNGTGIWGEGANQGVYGTSELSTGKGVYGNSTHATGIAYGVYGQSSSVAGYGVYGTAPVYGVYGICSSDNGRAVRGEATATTGSADGIYGSTNAVNGCGVYGIALHATGETYGGRFTATSSTGTGVKADGDKYGVYGIASAIQSYGIYGETAGQQGTGVIGKATGTSSIGVRGEGTLCDFYAAGPGLNYESSSSVRWKTNIKPIPKPLEKLMALRGVYFIWDEDHGGQHDLGMIAEEVGKVLPEIVVYEENGIDACGMDYSKITPLLVEALKAQQIEIEMLKARLEKLEGKAANKDNL